MSKRPRTPIADGVPTLRLVHDRDRGDDGQDRAADPVAPDAWRMGAARAIELLEEACDLDAMQLSDINRAGRPQDNVVLRYLRGLRSLDDPRVDAFCAVLTDYIASSQEGVVPDVAFLKKLSRKPIATRAG